MPRALPRDREAVQCATAHGPAGRQGRAQRSPRQRETPRRDRKRGATRSGSTQPRALDGTANKAGAAPTRSWAPACRRKAPLRQAAAVANVGGPACLPVPEKRDQRRAHATPDRGRNHGQPVGAGSFYDSLRMGPRSSMPGQALRSRPQHQVGARRFAQTCGAPTRPGLLARSGEAAGYRLGGKWSCARCCFRSCSRTDGTPGGESAPRRRRRSLTDLARAPIVSTGRNGRGDGTVEGAYRRPRGKCSGRRRPVRNKPGVSSRDRARIATAYLKVNHRSLSETLRRSSGAQCGIPCVSAPLGRDRGPPRRLAVEDHCGNQDRLAVALGPARK